MDETRCPVCGAGSVEVAEDVSDEVIVLRCTACSRTWADRTRT